MKASIDDTLRRIPGPPNAQYPAGTPSVVALQHGSMALRLFRPSANPDGRDHQVPHGQDEVYLVQGGSAEIVIGESRLPARAGDAFFVPAGQPHRFEHISPDFVTWVVFYGPQGGET